LSSPSEYAVVLVHRTDKVAVAFIADVSRNALPKSRPVVEMLQPAATVAIQGDDPAVAVLPGLDEQFGLKTI